MLYIGKQKSVVANTGTNHLLTVDELEAKRSLITTNKVAILLLLFYVMIGIIHYTVVAQELTTLDAVYFAVQTLLMIGYGTYTAVELPLKCPTLFLPAFLTTPIKPLTINSPSFSIFRRHP